MYIGNRIDNIGRNSGRALAQSSQEVGGRSPIARRGHLVEK